MTSPDHPAAHGDVHEEERPPVRPGPGVRWAGDGMLAPKRAPQWASEAAASPIDRAHRRPTLDGTVSGIALATLPRRLACWFVDRALKAIVFVVIVSVAGVEVTNASWPSSELILASALLNAGYDFVFGIHGVTPAAFVMRIRIVRVDGAEPGVRRSLVRAAGAALSESVFFIGAWVALFDARRQTLYDKLAGTAVVEAPRAAEKVARVEETEH